MWQLQSMDYKQRDSGLDKIRRKIPCPLANCGCSPKIELVPDSCKGHFARCASFEQNGGKFPFVVQLVFLDIPIRVTNCPPCSDAKGTLPAIRPRTSSCGETFTPKGCSALLVVIQRGSNSRTLTESPQDFLTPSQSSGPVKTGSSVPRRTGSLTPWD